MAYCPQAGKQLYRKDPVRNRCVACKTELEDWHHLLRCPHDPQQKWCNDMLLAVTAKCENLDTRPALQRVLLAGLNGWLASGNNSFILESGKFHIEMKNSSRTKINSDGTSRFWDGSVGTGAIFKTPTMPSNAHKERRKGTQASGGRQQSLAKSGISGTWCG
jgi:hypothetical protein